MKVSSVNIGNSQTIIWRGKEIQTGIYKRSVNHPIYLGSEDVKKDHVIDRRYHGGLDKACYLFSETHYDFWKARYPNLEWNWGMFGENLTIKDLDEKELLVGDVYRIGDTTVQITQPRQPCFKLGVKFGTQKMVKEFVESGHSGAYVRVIKSGNVQKGDELILMEKAEESMSIRDIFNLLYADKSFIEDAKAALKIESLADACKIDLAKHFGI